MRPLALMTTWGISRRFQQLSPSSGQVTYVLLTRSPLSWLLVTGYWLLAS
jgi:hypothetical protein